MSRSERPTLAQLQETPAAQAAADAYVAHVDSCSVCSATHDRYTDAQPLQKIYLATE